MEGAIDHFLIIRQNHIPSVMYTDISDYSGALYFLMKERQMYAFCYANSEGEDKTNAEHGFWRTEQKIKLYLNIL